MKRNPNKKYYLTREANIPALKQQHFDILDYDDLGYRDRNRTDYFHRCPAPWSKYAIRPDGRCMDLHDGRTFDPLPGGKYQKYPNLSLALDKKDATESVTVHRVLAGTFLENHTGLPFSECHVDHQNCDKSDYRLSNLKIVTPRENKALAYTKNERHDNFNTRVFDLETEETVDFYSQAAAARYVGVSNQRLSYLFKTREIIEEWPFLVWRITREEYNRPLDW